LNHTKDLYEFIATPRHLMLQNKFYKLTMQDDTSMLDFLFITKDLLVQIVGIGDVIKDEDVILTILNVLPKPYENFLLSMLAQKKFPNFDQLTSKLL
jgi:hypothetical protein